MKITEKYSKTAEQIDYGLRSEDFADVPLVEGLRRASYAKWYAELLTTLTVIIDDQPVKYWQTDYNADQGTVRFVIFTEQVVILVDGQGIATDHPTITTQIVGRRSLTSIQPAASMRLDQEGSAAYAWPGDIQITATYLGLSSPIVLAQKGYDAADSNEPSSILNLLLVMQRELNS